jgi:hypothetical protein
MQPLPFYPSLPLLIPHRPILRTQPLEKPADVLCYTVSPRGVGTHDVDEWLASWSPRVAMERSSRQARLRHYKDAQNADMKTARASRDRDRESGRNRLFPRSFLAQGAVGDEKGDLGGGVSSPSSSSPSSSLSGSALRAEIEKHETLGYIKSALVPPNGKYCTVLYCIELYCTVLHCAVVHYTALYCTVLHCAVVHCTVLYCTVLHCIVLHYTALYCTVLHCAVLYCTALYCTALHCAVLYCIALCCSALHCIVLYCTA